MPVDAPTISRPDLADDATMRAIFEVYSAACQADDPGGPLTSESEFRIRRTLAPPLGPPSELWYAGLPGLGEGGVGGWYWLKMPDMENLDRAELEITVHPAARRTGLGGALLRHAATRARANGRAILDTEVMQGSGGEAFARQAGATFGLADIRRVLNLAAVPASRFAQCRAGATAAADGYSLVRWTGRTPDEHVKGVAAMFTTMNDAPSRPGAEPDIWDEHRVRDRLDRRVAVFGFRAYQVAALCDATGEMAAMTELRVDPDVPDWGHQGNTAVGRPHRGHRLGLLVKAAMLQWLGSAEPQLRHVVTWNAAVNRHMIAINEELGFEVSGQPYLEIEIRVDDVLGPGPHAVSS